MIYDVPDEDLIPEGTVIESYTVKWPIKMTKMSVIYRVIRSDQDDGEWILKYPRYGKNWAVKEEEICVSILECPNALVPSEWFDYNERRCCVMRYIVTGDLHNYLSNMLNPILTIEEVRYYAKSILIAINFLHQRNYVFRDLKLENCLIDWDPKTSDTNLILCDFGFCEYLEPDHLFDKVAGTEIYLAPEQLKRQLYGKPVDMWAYGMVLYALITSALPFGIDDWKTKALKGEFDMDALEFCDAPQDAIDLISMCLNVDPDERITAENALMHDFFLGEMIALKQTVGSVAESFEAINHVVSDVMD